MPSAIASADLKAQGNALFGAKQFKEAGDKYTEAIQAGDEATDPKGMAVLYSNRAACRISLKRFMDAVGDALKATQLDPTYAKAHARLGSSLDALGNYNQSKKSWQQALDSLPHILSPAEKIQKVQYEAAVEAANSQLAVPVGVGLAPKDGRQPWDRAAAILPRLNLNVDKRIRSASSFSSAWVIYGAYEEFMTGSQIMNDLQLDPVTGQAVAGRLGAIRACCNGILRDSRIVNLMDFNFLEKYEEQLRLEMILTGLASWPGAGPESIIQEALARQRNEGWKAVRPALTLNICSWIMKVILDGASRRRYDLAMEPCKCSLEVLRSLKETWRDVPKDDRGFIFEDSFLFGIQHIYIDVIMQAYASNPTPELLEKLDTESDCLIQEVDAALRLAHPLQEVSEIGHFNSFYVYPRALAYAMKGYYYKKKSELKPDEMKEFSRKAGLAYLKLGDSFPQDDEQRPWFLKIALENLLNSRSCQVRMVLEIMKRITESAPKAKEIWEYSHLGMDLWVDLDKVKEQEDGLRLKVAQGIITMNACIGPGDV
ncbi:hypothetical protein C8R43DRAFT_1012912 [Mycena crocata]|nr:hypothetical protein C8R43DRAFT_1012912 [Mycena crocata]